MASDRKSKGGRRGAPGERRGGGLIPPARFSFRTPLLPAETYRDFGEGLSAGGAAEPELAEAVERDTDLLRQRLRELASRPEIRDALFVASPDTVASLDHWLSDPDGSRGQKVERTLVRYLSRMTGRCTPFGLFSAVSTGRVTEETNLQLAERSAYERHTRLDNDYLFALCEELLRSDSLRASLTWRPSSSLYEAAGRLRYAEARQAGRDRSYHLVAVEPDDYLRETIERARGGATRGELARALVESDPEIAEDEAEAFVDELIDSQILVSDLAPAVTGREPIEGILAVLGAAGDAGGAARTRLEAAARAIADLDAGGLGAPSERYRAIAEGLRSLPAGVELGRLFQVDLVKPAPDATLGKGVVAEMARGIELLRRLSPRPESRLADFRRRFLSRYEDRAVPLAHVLDEEVGIGFQASSAPGADASPLLAGLALAPPGDPPKRNWGAREVHLLELLQQASARGEREIVLGDRDIEALSAREPAELPDALACMAELAAPSAEDLRRGDYRFRLEAASGPSGARLSGRFCHASPELHEEILEHLRAEEALDPDAVFAEIAHLPEGRIGNISSRPVLREYELPFLGVSGARPERQIPIDDLLVSVERDAVVLRSRSLGKAVIPRLSTAHNYGSPRSLGMYRFLCALQEQHGNAVRFDWGPLSDAPFLPRVRVGRHVLARARWRLRTRDIEPLADAMKGLKKATTRDALRDLRARALAAARSLRERLGLPRHILLADGDNELPVDLENALSVDSFVQLVKSRPSATLLEDFGARETCAAGPEGSFRHELVVTFVRDREPTRREPAPPPPRGVARRFEPGSACLYAKLYTGASSADDVLRDAVAPVVRDAIAGGAADRWFFLRYGDPDWQVRVRLFGDPGRLVGEVLPALRAAAEPLFETGQVRRLALDTYERETERYGGPEGMELCEALFHADSDAVLEIVELLSGDEGQEARWRLTVRGADLLLRELGLDLDARLRLMTLSRDGFGREFGLGTRLQKQLGVVYREERERLGELLAYDPARDAEHDYAPGFEALARRSERLRPIARELIARDRAGQLSRPLEIIAGSLVHMHANRLLRSAARAQELVIYDLLKRSYEAERARRSR